MNEATKKAIAVTKEAIAAAAGSAQGSSIVAAETHAGKATNLALQKAHADLARVWGELATLVKDMDETEWGANKGVFEQFGGKPS